MRELRAQGDRIVDAIRDVGAGLTALREVVQRCAALDEPTPRTAGPTTPPCGPANDDEPESWPRR